MLRYFTIIWIKVFVRDQIICANIIFNIPRMYSYWIYISVRLRVHGWWKDAAIILVIIFSVVIQQIDVCLLQNRSASLSCLIRTEKWTCRYQQLINHFWHTVKSGQHNCSWSLVYSGFTLSSQKRRSHPVSDKASCLFRRHGLLVKCAYRLTHCPPINVPLVLNDAIFKCVVVVTFMSITIAITFR